MIVQDIMSSTEQDSDQSDPATLAGRSITAMEQRMREQIRLLQEQRAAAMMEEVVDLQRERDLALGRIKALKKNIEELTMENALLKGAIGRGDLTEKLISVERNYLEERLLNNDLRKKLQAATKQKGELALKVRKFEVELVTRNTLSPNVINSRDRSHSLTDLNESVLPNVSPEIHPIPSTPPSESNTSTPTAKLPPSGRKSSPPFLTVSSGQVTPGTLSGSNTPLSYSPAVIPRRYKLAAAVTRDASSQTDLIESDKLDVVPAQVNELQDVPRDVVATLENAKRDIIALQQEKEHLENDLSNVKFSYSQDRAAKKKEYALLKNECSVLKESLSEFSLWGRQKIKTFEDDMDIFKVVYSLHGSLSQEKSLLKDLREKLTKSEARAIRLESVNTQLQEELTHTEEKYKQSKKEIKRLHERTMKNTPPSYHSPSLQRGHPALRSYKSSGHTAEQQSSPLLSRTSPPMKAMFPVRVVKQTHNQV